ncbi:MAG: DUF4912 domain-containing protein [bacterium]|nr:DUF4912 domain-containing protein [bacterium]
MSSEIKPEGGRKRSAPAAQCRPVFVETPAFVPATFPDRYHETFLVLMDVEPHTLLAFWEIDEMDLERAQRELSTRNELVLRVYDVTHIIFDGGNAHSYFDVVVEGKAHNWYIHAGADGRSLIADIGLRGEDGRYVALARSNCVQMPRDRAPLDGEMKWMFVEGNPRERQPVPDEMYAPSSHPGPSVTIPLSGLAGLNGEDLMNSVGREDVLRFYHSLWRGPEEA